jgi:hypothetical protein
VTADDNLIQKEEMFSLISQANGRGIFPGEGRLSLIERNTFSAK